MMNYKGRLILLFVGTFFLILAATLAFVYAAYAEFRREEYWDRLHQKSLNTANLLLEVKEVDKHLLKIIDRNSIQQMFDEKVLVFNEKNELVYSSLDDEPIRYSPALLNRVRAEERIFYTDSDGDEVVGVHYTGSERNYVVLASAYDKWGKRKLRNLLQTLVVALLVGTSLIVLASYFYIRQVFRPIDRLNKSIRSITENNLKQYLPVRNRRDELDQLAQNYNQMQERLHRAFELQRSFVHNASHELKTPLARMNSKVEKALRHQKQDVGLLRNTLELLQHDIGEQAGLIESLLLLHRLQSSSPITKSKIRLDELLFQSMNEAQILFPLLHVHLNMDESITSEEQLIVQANPHLLKTCFQNLLTNAANYASDQTVHIDVKAEERKLYIVFTNAGKAALSEKLLFEPFYRGENAAKTAGSGLGLSIVKHIAEHIGGGITYSFSTGNHTFRLALPLHF